MIKYIQYEVKNALGNIFTVIFGFIFPALITLIFYFAFSSSNQGDNLEQFKIGMFVSNLMIAPLAILLIGFSALFSQEIEKQVALRMSLLGYDEKKQFLAKFIAQFLVMMASLIVYSMIVYPVLNIKSFNVIGLFMIGLLILILSFSIFMIAFGLSMLAKKFSIAYGISMSTYFIVLVLSGMMGVSSDNLPVGLKEVSLALPTTHIVKHGYQLWMHISFDSWGLILSMSGCLIFSVVLFNRFN